jgi:HSP20 family molecular chaperone IbpA
MGSLPEGSTSYSYHAGSMYSDPENDNELRREKEADIERIDLDDEALFLVNIGYEESEPSVRIDPGIMTITFGIEHQTIKADLDFDVDIDNSNVSSRNGVLEISLRIAKKSSSGAREGYLRIN